MRVIFSFVSFVLALSVSAQLSYQWSGSASSNLSELAQAIAVDPSGNVYVAGNFSGTTDFDPGPGTTTLSGVSGSQDAFIAKYSSAGAFLWVKQIGGTNTERTYDLTADASGVYISGNFMGTCNFNIGGVTSTLTSLGGGVDGDGFVASYNTSGTLNWVNRIGSTANDRAISLVVDGTGNLFVTGFIGANADFDPGPGVTTLSVSGTYNAYFVKYSSAGALSFVKQITGGYSEGDAINIDASGNIYITGSYALSNDFDPGAGTFNMSTATLTQLDIFLAKYNNLGNFTYAKQIGGVGVDIGFGIQPDASGNVYLGGVFSATCDFNPAAGFTNNIVSNGQGDLFVAKYDASGNYIWANGAGGTTNDYCYGLTLDGSSNVYITGRFLGTNIDFDPGPGTAAITGSSNTFYVAGYNSAGTFSFVNMVGNVPSEGRGVLVSNSSLYVSGMFQSVADFDFSPATATLTSAGSDDAFFAKYNLCNGVAPSQPSAIAGNTNVCIGSNQTYSVMNDPNAVSYSWLLPGGWTGTSTTNIISAVSGTTGLISVVANGTCGSSIPSTINVVVNPLPVLTASNNAPLCSGNNLQLSASGASTYSWAGPNSFTSAIQNPVISNAQVNNSGTYTIIGTTTAGCTSSITTNATLHPLPVPTSSNNGPVCVGSNLLLFASGGNTYAWSGPSGYNSPVQNPTITNASVLNSGNYTLIVTSAQSCTAGTTMPVTVSPVPTPSISSNSPVCAGSVLSLSVSGPGNYLWAGPTGFTSAIQTPSLNNAQPVNTGVYSVTVTVGSCSGTASGSVTVNALPVLTISASSYSFCSGQSTSLSVAGANSYSWSNGSTGSVIVVSPATSTLYNVTGSSINSCTNVASLNLTVFALPVLTVSSTSSLLCVGQTATLSAAGAQSYTWNTGATQLSVAVAPTITTVYTVVAADLNSCSATQQFTQSVTICSGLAEITHVTPPLEVFPNPASDRVIISTGMKRAEVLLISASGQVLFSTYSETESICVNISEMSAGLYLVRLVNGTEVKQQRLIITR